MSSFIINSNMNEILFEMFFTAWSYWFPLYTLSCQCLVPAFKGLITLTISIAQTLVFTLFGEISRVVLLLVCFVRLVWNRWNILALFSVSSVCQCSALCWDVKGKSQNFLIKHSKSISMRIQKFYQYYVLMPAHTENLQCSDS